MKGDKLSVSGGDLSGVVVLGKGSAGAAKLAAKTPAKASSGNAQELVGKWCRLSTFYNKAPW